MGTKSICPKCGQEGTQNIWTSNSYRSPNKRYSRFIHKKGKICYIGRVRTTKEVIGEFEKEGDTEKELSPSEYVKALKGIQREIKSLIKIYSPNTAVRMSVLSKKLMVILNKYYP